MKLSQLTPALLMCSATVVAAGVPDRAAFWKISCFRPGLPLLASVTKLVVRAASEMFGTPRS